MVYHRAGAGGASRTHFNYNLYFAPGSARWSWNNVAVTGLSAWQRVASQDSHSLFADPRFVSTAAAADLHLSAGSPAIDAGDPTYHGAADEADIDMSSRVGDGRIDLGADEFSQ